VERRSHINKQWQTPKLDLRSAKSVKEILEAIAGIRNLSISETSTPWSFPEMHKAIQRMQKAVQEKEVIGIFGDYDCDGVTGTALMVRALRRRNVRPVVRLPHRTKEGYGIKMLHIEELAKRGVTLLCTIDTGIGAAKEVAKAKEMGMDVIILDHHHVPEIPALPYAALHPSLSKDWKGAAPSAAGVVWEFVRAWEEIEQAEWIERDHDLVLGALGTVADLVEVRDGNRELVKQGVLALSRVTTGPLAELALQAGIKGIGTARDFGFRLAPRINAAGRMDDPMIALKAVLGDKNSLLELERLNIERQENVRGHWGEIEQPKISEDPFLFVTSAEYTPGIVGLLAGKLTEQYGKPSLVGSIQGENVTASLRSINGYNVTEALGRASDLLLGFGGHAKAAGCTFNVQKTEELRARLNADLLARVNPDSLVPLLSFDAVIAVEQLNMELGKALALLEPHGQGNELPRFLLEGVKLEEVRTMGGEGAHLNAMMGDARVVGFGFGSLAKKLEEEPADIAGHIQVQTWNGQTRLEFFVEDVRFEQGMENAQIRSANVQISSSGKDN
jgi:single-stranded-DNA-specific exonuclease